MLVAVMPLWLSGCSNGDDSETKLSITVTVKADETLHNNTETTFSATVSQAVDEITFYFDGESIGSSLYSPYTIKYTPKNITPGNHKVTCIAKHKGETFTGETPVRIELRLGDEYQGGKIFYLNGSGDHGLIGALEDLSRKDDNSDVGFIWGGYESLLGTNLDDGVSNTNKMAAISTSTGYAGYAFKSSYEYNGYKDWYIPSYNELELLSENKEYIGTFKRSDINWQNYYWSSSESSDKNAFCLNFFALAGNTSEKNLNRKIRVIRKF